MGILVTRVRAVSNYVAELIAHGLPGVEGTIDREVLFILDGVGGFQFAPALIRRAIRLEKTAMPTIYYRWQFGLPGEIWTDLMWLRRNRVMAVHLARRILRFHRAHPRVLIHLAAFSGGAGIAAFALQHLRSRATIETLVFACPALSPSYNLGPALHNVRRAYALISRADSAILGWGTRIFGTTDRRYTAAAGNVGFRVPAAATDDDRRAYQCLAQIEWTPSMKSEGHSGGHTGWVSLPWLRRHFLPLLRGNPQLPVHPVPQS